MFESRQGQAVPSVTFAFVRSDGIQSVSTDELFGGKTVVVFSLPGAFTPTCSSAHVPRFNQLAPVFKSHGVDEVYCISVNDGFVMNAWQEHQDADQITFVPDGNGTFTEGLGLLVDKSELGFGKRSWRYAMVVKDGLIDKMFIEPVKPGDPYEVSDADTVLSYVAPEAAKPADILLLTKPGCSHCRRAKALLHDRDLSYEEVEATISMLRAVSEQPTTPRVFVDGVLLGGADELEAWLTAQ